MADSSRFRRLLGGSLIGVAVGSPTLIHQAGPPDIGRLRGEVVRLRLSNAERAASAVVLTAGSDSSTFSLPGNGTVRLDLWLDPGAVLVGQAEDAGVTASGYSVVVP